MYCMIDVLFPELVIQQSLIIEDPSEDEVFHAWFTPGSQGLKGINR